MPALFVTIWVALLLFVAGETGRSFAHRGSRPPWWAWWAFTLGLLLALVHTVLAFDIVHNWIHDDAVLSTAQQTEAMFGVSVGWGVYVNYVFFAVWLADSVWWRASPDVHRRPAGVMWALRVFYLIIIVNAAVIFAVGWRRIVGILIVSWLVRVWTLRRNSGLSSRHRR